MHLGNRVSPSLVRDLLVPIFLPFSFLKSFARQIRLVFQVVLLPKRDVAIALQEPEQVGSHCASCYADPREQCGAGTANVKEKATPGRGDEQARGNGRILAYT